MDVLLSLLAIAASLLVVAAPVLAIAALARTAAIGSLARRVEDLERDLRHLRSAQGPERSDVPVRLEPAPLTPHSGGAEGPSGAWTAGPQDFSAPGQPELDWPSDRAARPRSRFDPLTALRKVEWERWIGIRGAAILGGIALALAGLFLFQHGIEHGWFGPELRVTAGACLGLACLLGKEVLAQRGYTILSEVIAGAGTVILYAAAWAGARLYGLFPPSVAFAWMALVTAAACLLAVRHRSQVIALFALVGGFATPLLLSSGADRPVGLFGYVLLLDLGLLATGRRMRSPLIVLLGLVGTALIQGMWVLARMDPHEAGLGLGVLGMFALLFVIAARQPGGREGMLWAWTRMTALLLPLVFALHFGMRVDLGDHLYPLGALLALLAAGASWVGREQASPRLPLGTALGSSGVSLAWILSRPLDGAQAWELAGVTGVLALIYLAFGEWNVRRPVARVETEQRAKPAVPALAALERAGAPALVFALSLAIGLLVETARRSPAPAFWPWACAALFLTAVQLRGAYLVRSGLAATIASSVLGAILSVYATLHVGAEAHVPRSTVLYVALAVCAVLLTLRARGWTAGPQAWLRACAAVCALPVLLTFLDVELGHPALHLGLSLAFAAVALLSAARARSAGLYALIAVAVAGGIWVWNVWAAHRLGSAAPALQGFGWQLGTAALIAWLPCIVRSRMAPPRAIGFLAAASLLLWFTPPVLELYETVAGRRGILVIPLVLSSVGWIGARAASRAVRPAYQAMAALLACVALPFEIDVAWGAVGAALTGLAWILLAERHAERTLRKAGVAALILACVALGVLAVVPDTFQRSAALLANRLSYAYLVPAACVLVGAWRLGADERSRRAVAVLGIGAALTVFGWLNLVVLNAYAEGSYVAFELERLPGRDLAQSLAWTLYAFAILGLGTALRASGLRWLSLAFLLAAIFKVFLYDLGELQGLYRVSSMLGLALCLLGVSLLYQRFVFREPAAS